MSADRREGGAHRQDLGLSLGLQQPTLAHLQRRRRSLLGQARQPLQPVSDPAGEPLELFSPLQRITPTLQRPRRGGLP